MPRGLDDLLDVLPLSANAPPLAVESVPPGVRYVTTARPEFVPPSLAVDTEALRRCQVVVISAPAAVGKSMLAEHIALRTGGILWDLAQSRVGNNFALGTLAASHGAALLGDVLDRVHSGRFAVIADALDEARLRVNFNAFAAFLDDLSRDLAKPVAYGQPSIVLLARSETAEFAADWLRDIGLSVADATIELFSRPDAVTFVERQLLALGSDPSNQAIQEARELVFERTLTMLTAADDGADSQADTDGWPTDAARRFLGYAPVLVAAARYLDSGGNPKRIVEDLSVERSTSAMWQLLLRLVRDILEREQGKFLSGFKESIRTKIELLGFEDWSAAFGPREQCAWLVTEVLGAPPPPSPPIPDDVQAEYRAAVRDWLAQHPFVGSDPHEFASPVFEDFTYAETLVSGDEDYRAAVRARASDATYRPTEALARFVAVLATEAIVAEDFPIIYESLLASEEAGRRTALYLFEEEPPGDGEMEATIFLGGDLMVLRLIAAGEPLRFITKLTRASVFLRTSSVQLGVGGRLFEIGPHTYVLAPSIEVVAETLLVHEPFTDIEIEYSALLFAGSVTATDPALRFIAGGDKIGIRSDANLRYPFADKALPAAQFPGQFTTKDRQMATAMFRVAAYFKIEGYSRSLGTYAEALDRQAARSPTVAALLEAGLERGVFTREGGFYRMHPEILGLDYRAVQAHDLTPQAREFVQQAASRMP